jgi:predicted RNase H-like nuclease
MRVAGVDGCRTGWVVWSKCNEVHSVTFVSTLAEIPFEKFEIVAIDMPMGLLDLPRKGGREAEIEVRKRLQQPRKSSVFSSPSRIALADFRNCPKTEAVFKSIKDKKGINLQSFYILDKIAELDDLLQNLNVRSVSREAHPEYAFALMGNSRGVVATKLSPEGKMERTTLLQANGFPPEELNKRLPGAKRDDIIDAAVCCWVAEGIAKNEAHSLPPQREIDREGIRMAIWGRGPAPSALTLPRKGGGNKGRQISSAAR